MQLFFFGSVVQGAAFVKTGIEITCQSSWQIRSKPGAKKQSFPAPKRGAGRVPEAGAALARRGALTVPCIAQEGRMPQNLKGL